MDIAADAPLRRPVSRATIWYIFPPIGGPGLGRYWRAYHLARVWQRLGADPVLIGPGYHHYFVRPDPLAGTHTIGGVDYHFIPTQPYGRRSRDRVKAILAFGVGLLRDRGLASLAQRRAPDVIIYSSPYPFAYVAAYRLARRLGAALVFEVRDLWPLSLIEILGLPRWHPFVLAAGACERFAYATADRVASLLPEAASYMAERGLDGRKFAYIPNGVDVEQETVPASGTAGALIRRAQALAAAGKFLLVHPGNMSVTTDLFPLLKAAKLLQEQGRRDVVVLLVGSGELEPALKLHARQQGLANVEFFPPVDKSEVAALLRIAHAGFAALPSKPIYRYGFSLNKLFDYMLAGLPVVFSCDLPSRMVDKAGAVVAVPASDAPAIAAAIIRLAGLPASERASIGARGRALVEAEHNYETLGRRYLNLIEGLPRSRQFGAGEWRGPERDPPALPL